MIVVIQPGLAAVVRVEHHGELLLVLPEAAADDVLNLACAVLDPGELHQLADRLFGVVATAPRSER